MSANESLDEVLRIKKELSAETQGMDAEELQEFFRARRPPWAEKLLKRKPVEAVSKSESESASQDR